MRIPIRNTLITALLITGATAFAGSFTSDFTNPNQAGFTLNGAGTLSTDGSTWMPIIGNGSLVLTTNDLNLQGSMVLDDIDAAQPIAGFTAKFQLQMGPGSGNPADGFWFGFSPDINSSSISSEEGPGIQDGGVGVEFDVYDNGLAVQDSIGIDVMAGNQTGPFNGNNHNEIALHPLAKADMVTSSFKQVVIQMNRNGTLNLTYGAETIYSNLYVYGWAPTAGQFMLDARTGGENQMCIVSNLTITTTPVTTFAPASITSQPQSVSVKEGETATIRVGFDGSAPIGFKWAKNGTPIELTTASPLTTDSLSAAVKAGSTIEAFGPFNVLTITNASPADNNAKFTVTVANTNTDGTVSSVTSQAATLTVQADLTAPTLVSATPSNDFQHVTLVFSKPISTSSAQTLANYAFNNGLTVTAAEVSTNNANTVFLTTSPQVSGTSYTLTLNGIKDTSFTGNPIGANTTANFTSPVLNVTGVGGLLDPDGKTIDVGVQFSLPVDQASATALANYKLSAGSITSVLYEPKTPGVVLSTSGLSAGQTYTLTVANVANLGGGKLASTNVTFAVSGMAWGVVGANQLGLTNAVVAVGTNGFDVYSDGYTEWGTYDETTFVYQKITGDFDKKLRVEYQDASSQWARAGLIARDVPNFGVDSDTQSNGAAGRYQKIHVNPVGPTLTGPGNLGNASWEGNRRLDTGGATTTALTGPNAVPQYPNAWCRLQRQGQKFTIYRSDDGINWVNLGSTTWPDPNDPTATPMPDTLYVGPEYSPENGNITNESDRSVFVAKIRDYSDTATPVSQNPTLSATRTANGLKLTFTGTLQSADSITGPWTAVNGTSPLTVTTTGSAKFYRASQ